MRSSRGGIFLLCGGEQIFQCFALFVQGDGAVLGHGRADLVEGGAGFALFRFEGAGQRAGGAVAVGAHVKQAFDLGADESFDQWVLLCSISSRQKVATGMSAYSLSVKKENSSR